MTSQRFALHSSLAGTVPTMLANMFWLIIFGLIFGWLSGQAAETIAKAEVLANSELGIWSTFLYLKDTPQSAMDEIWFMLQVIFAAVMGLLILASIFGLIDCFYNAHTVNVIDLGKKTLSTRTISFPFAQSVKNVRIDRLTTISVDQSTLERLLGVGTIKLSYLRNENFESAHDEWEIPYLDNPVALKAQLDELLSLGGAEQLDLRSRTRA